MHNLHVSIRVERGRKALKLVDFAAERGVHRDTITQYIRRHGEEFQGHTEVKGKLMYLDSEAVEMLDKAYPLPKPVEIIEDTESRAKLIKAQELIVQLQQKNMELVEKISEQSALVAQAEAQKMLLEDKEKQLKEEKERLKTAETGLSMAISERDKAREDAAEAEKAVQEAKNEIERLKNRNLWERIRNL